MKRPILTMPAILLLLALLVFAPSILMGYQYERNARAALVVSDYLEAAEQFELAAQRLYWKPELWNEAGDAYWVVKDQPSMAAALENARRQGALNACGWEKLGWLYAADIDHAIQIWLEGLSHYPDHVILYQYLAGTSRYDEKYGLELNYLLDALAYEDNALYCEFVNQVNFPRMHYRTGVLLILDDPARALDELNTAARMDDGYASVVETLRTTLNLASLEDDPAEKLILIGRGLGLAEEWELAASTFDNATQADPENASAWAWLGEARYQVSRQDPGDMFAMAASIDPNSQTLLSLRGLYAQRVGDLEVAVHDFEELAELDPENPTWQTSLGALYAEQGDLPTALAAYEKAIDLEPTNPLYRQLLALFSFDYRYDMAGIGLSAARRAVILSPEEARYIDTLGLLYFGQERDEDAERQFLRALEKDADFAAVHLHLGMLYLQRGDRDLAYASLKQARELDKFGAVGTESWNLLKKYFQQ